MLTKNEVNVIRIFERDIEMNERRIHELQEMNRILCWRITDIEEQAEEADESVSGESPDPNWMNP